MGADNDMRDRRDRCFGRAGGLESRSGSRQDCGRNLECSNRVLENLKSKVYGRIQRRAYEVGRRRKVVEGTWNQNWSRRNGFCQNRNQIEQVPLIRDGNLVI